jgi:phosphoribosylamine-glycine ligase
MASHLVLIIGRGGREHALAWKLAQSPRVERVWVAPGNGGTALAGGKVANVDLPEDDFAALIDFAQRSGVTLTVVGPETPLADGIGDAFQAAGLRCFGPSRAAAQIEASKAFAKDFMVRHGIPTARHATFTDFDAALAHLRQVDYPVVLKASGLAAGKGVILPASLAEAEAALRQIMLAREFGAAGDEVVIEERLAGPEASVLAFSDGRSVALMPAAQDHKRVFDDDQGPNTGGMGAYAPAPLMPPALLDEVRRAVLQPAIDGLAAEGTPFVGVLYAGIMLTGSRYGADAYSTSGAEGSRYGADAYSTSGAEGSRYGADAYSTSGAEGSRYGADAYSTSGAEGSRYGADAYSTSGAEGSRYGADAYSTSDSETDHRSPITDHRPPFHVLEFNCRFGDPETQVILPLLESDLVDVIEACLAGRLAELDVRWRAGAAATIVAASEGYPGSYPKGREISGVAEAEALPGVAVFHAGTRLETNGRLLTDGGRVLAVTGVGDGLRAALAGAYSGIEHIRFQGLHYRRDIGAKAIVG